MTSVFVRGHYSQSDGVWWPQSVVSSHSHILLRSTWDLNMLYLSDHSNNRKCENTDLFQQLDRTFFVIFYSLDTRLLHILISWGWIKVLLVILFKHGDWFGFSKSFSLHLSAFLEETGLPVSRSSTGEACLCAAGACLDGLVTVWTTGYQTCFLDRNISFVRNVGQGCKQKKDKTSPRSPRFAHRGEFILHLKPHNTLTFRTCWIQEMGYF